MSRVRKPQELTLVAATVLVVTIVAAVGVAPSVTQNATPFPSGAPRFILTGISIIAPPQPEGPRGMPVAKGDVIVQYKSGVIASPIASGVIGSIASGVMTPIASAAISAANKQVGATLVYISTIAPGMTLVKLPAGVSVDAAIARYKLNPDVEGAWPNNRYTLDAMPNHPDFRDQWALRNTGQPVLNITGTPGDDINASGAWNTTTGSSSVIVAVADTGVAFNHPDLEANVGPGWNFADNSPNPFPFHVAESEHGTHVAGIIGATATSSIGVVGVSPKVTIMPLLITDKGSGYISTLFAVEAIKYAEQHGASIINFSWGGPAGVNDSSKDLLYATIQQSPLLFVCAAGNDGNNNDQTPTYPASYGLPNIISVAATDNNGRLPSWSNYGRTSVDLAAPGVNIYSTVYEYGKGYEFGYMSGTSMAAPYVSGVAALVKAAHPSDGYAELKSAILNSSDPLPAFAARTVTGGMLDARKAVLDNASAGSPSPSTRPPATTSVTT